jgi:hypothetical protein
MFTRCEVAHILWNVQQGVIECRTRVLAPSAIFIIIGTSCNISNLKLYQCGLCIWPKCNHLLNWFFLPKPGSLKFIWIFSGRNHLKNQYLPHSESKSYQINSIKSCSSRSFQEHQRHIPIPLKFSVKKSFNIQELLHCKSKCHGTKPMHPSLSRAFQRHQEYYLKNPASVDLITTKQNKLPSFIVRFELWNTWWSCCWFFPPKLVI